MKRLFFLTYICVNHIVTIAQENDTAVLKEGVSVYPLPVVYYTPETRFGFGGVGLFSFRFEDELESIRNSQFQVGGAYTQESQLLFYAPFQLYYKNEKYYSFGELGYYRYNYFFYGVGNQIDRDYEEVYDVNFPRVRLNFMQLVRPQWYVGLRYWFDEYNIIRSEENSILGTNSVLGASGGTISSLGIISLLDSRDNYNYPSSGDYLELLALPNLKQLGSDFEYTRFSIDYVKYLSYKKNILALNFFGVSILGQAPFNELAFIGGTKKMRGYYEGRFRDRNLLMTQAEFRRMLFWRIGVTAFAGYGVVAKNLNGFASKNIRPSGGIGLRYRLEEIEKINVRLDFGYGEGANSGIYLTIGEAF